MYAIVEIQGQQFKARRARSSSSTTSKDVEAGKTVEFDKVLLVDADGAAR
jgi:LSU ribosomal protein L21P